MNYSQYLQEILLNLNHECTSYLGRNMYGRACVSITVEPSQNIAGLAARIISAHYDNQPESWDVNDEVPAELEQLKHENILQEIIEILDDTRTDQMGMMKVVYWPKTEWNPL